MKIRWPRRRWAVRFVLDTPYGPEPPYISPARYWTRAGAQEARDAERALYEAEPGLVGKVALDVVEAGPFNEAQWERDLDEAERVVREQRRAARWPR